MLLHCPEYVWCLEFFFCRMVKYMLYGVLVHHGLSVNSGHYNCYAMDGDGR
jgi:ubiquitin C-terminal hydrolase